MTPSRTSAETPPSRTNAEIAALAEDVARRLAETAVARDQRGGTAKTERDLLRASGLLTMSTPVEHGGWGAGWAATQEVVRTLARADGSLAHLFGFHHLMLATARLFGAKPQWVQAYEEAAQHSYFWGNALNPLDPRTTLAPAPDGFVLNGGM
jgi:alkylation response protein AidB-like acyl-CoA dehydrogenase